MSDELPNETTPLLGPTQVPESSSLPVPATAVPTPHRVHFLDNLRATLTILLILHHSALETVYKRNYSDQYTKSQLLPFSLFTAINKSYLWSLFFFTSGYSTSLSLLSKSSDRHFLKSRTLKIGLPALVYAYGGHLILFLYLAFGWEDIFGSYKAGWAFIRLSGPIDYVAILLVLDYIHLCVRWTRRRWPERFAIISNSRIFNLLRPTSRLRFYTLVTSFMTILVVFTFLSCIGIHLPPNVIFFAFPYDHPGVDVPLSGVIAYLTGVHFSSIRRYLTIKPSLAYATLFLSTFVAYLSMAVVQSISPPLWRFIELPTLFSSIYFFIDGGFNPHTIFFTFWNALVFLTIPISLISIFAQAPWATRDWGFWTRHTYTQTYINMIFILIAIHRFQSIHNLFIRTVLVGIFGVIGSWLMVYTPILTLRAVEYLVRRYHRVLGVSDSP
ncbi:hypothetical protein GALMADRAFT_254753 [Galerina marginata CBS 339.88]|uniref:Acyltransferase 3 domain-containing protein n=1 Tax=Galerina marginata (strain CBS 339.88) TaxID=685588 RepID=A0A067SID9_GALM3|nr:hypothetical protein GALMADRAFT_254753 [Galerina marginata CBS 339.88]